MITGIDAHYFLAKDLARALRFYREALQLETTTDFGGRGCEFTLADGSAFGVTAMPDATWSQSGGVMFAVPDIGAAAERVRSGGGTFSSGVVESPVCHVQCCGDTERNIFALHRRKE